MESIALEKSIQNIKLRFAKMYKAANAGHIGSSLSCTEMMAYIFCNALKPEDDFVLSKGHAAAVLYACLRETGVLSDTDIDTFYKNNSYLAAHPPPNKIAKIPFATGSLGHGLSIASGLAYANKLLQKQHFVYCITSDGEINEGSTWEAAMFIAHHQLNNLIWLIDKNNLQGFDTTKNVMNLDPLDRKLAAFGFQVLTIDGHNINQIHEAVSKARSTSVPTVVICNTLKGNNWKKYENTLASHYLPFGDDDYQEFVHQIKTND